MRSFVPASAPISLDEVAPILKRFSETGNSSLSCHVLAVLAADATGSIGRPCVLGAAVLRRQEDERPERVLSGRDGGREVSSDAVCSSSTITKRSRKMLTRPNLQSGVRKGQVEWLPRLSHLPRAESGNGRVDFPFRRCPVSRWRLVVAEDDAVARCRNRIISYLPLFSDQARFASARVWMDAALSEVRFDTMLASTFSW